MIIQRTHRRWARAVGATFVLQLPDCLATAAGRRLAPSRAFVKTRGTVGVVGDHTVVSVVASRRRSRADRLDKFGLSENNRICRRHGCLILRGPAIVGAVPRWSNRLIFAVERGARMPARNDANVVIVVLVLGVGLGGCARGTSKASVRYATYQYSCCNATDLIPVRQGNDEVATLHWTALPAPPTTARAAIPVSLAAALTGPFPDVAELKTAMASKPRRSPTIVAVTVRTTDQVGGAPVSTFRFPTTTPAGLYDITTTVAFAGGSQTADGVVQVGPVT